MSHFFRCFSLLQLVLLLAVGVQCFTIQTGKLHSDASLRNQQLPFRRKVTFLGDTSSENEPEKDLFDFYMESEEMLSPSVKDLASNPLFANGNLYKERNGSSPSNVTKETDVAYKTDEVTTLKNGANSESSNNGVNGNTDNNSPFEAIAHWSEIMSEGWTDSAVNPYRNSGDDDDDNNVNTFPKNGIKKIPVVSNNSVGGMMIPGSQGILDDPLLGDDDLEEIESYWTRLVPTVSYLGTEQVAKIYKALCVAFKSHKGQVRKSGEPFIVHPVEVALLLSGLKMDGETVMAGLLHDTVEDTELTFAQVESLFGKTVRSIVEGETKVSKLPKQLAFEGDDGSGKNEQEHNKQADEQAENLRQMFVAMTDDYRIIIVKLADRLHNMRTLQHMKPHKQIKISRETLDIFAPLAHRMGIWQFKSELEDIAFMYLYPTEYNRLHRRLQQHADKFKDTLENSNKLLQQRLDNDPILQQQAAKVEVMGRTKEIYSLWHKMETKNIRNLDNVIDVVALRVIVTPNPAPDGESDETDRGVWLCYHVLGLVQHLHGFQPVPTRVKDYISFPKPNGYQSLHTALMLNGQTVEVQIRTSMMHQVAEYGMASHWAYTDGKRRSLTNGDELYNTPWLSSIKEWQNDRISSRDFVDSVRRELLGKRVFVFLRNGKILNLARGATAIDAAFQIHTEVGLSMHGVEINGRPVPLSYELKNGDVVSVLTGNGKPATDWMRYAKSRSTRSKLRAYFRARQMESFRQAGKILLQDYLFRHGPLIEKTSFLTGNFSIPVPGSTDFENDLNVFLPNSKTQYDDVADLLTAIGKNHDRNLLHTVVSQLFGVPKRVLLAAEDKSRQPENILAAVLDRRRKANNIMNKATSAADYQKNLLKFQYRKARDGVIVRQQPYPAEDSPTSVSFDNFFSGLKLSKAEYADPENLCQDCLPVHGDGIVGTQPCLPNGKPDQNVIPTVHRIGCVHAQRAFNHAWAEQRIYQPSKNSTNVIVDSVTLRQRQKQMKPRKNGNMIYQENLTPVKLEWYDLDRDDKSNHEFLTEIVVHATDRKQLLADCSLIVSDMSEIVKTGSLTTKDHATLVFLVKVRSISHTQALMDRLSQVGSVMLVERKFGSELL